MNQPENYDFDFFYTTFGAYVTTTQGREDVDVINEMERQLNVLAQQAFGNVVMNPHQATGYVNQEKRARRAALATPERVAKLQGVIAAVRNFLGSDLA